MRTESRRQIAYGSLLLSFALTLVTSGLSQAPVMPGGEPTQAVSLGSDEITFETYRGYLIVVQGSLGGAQRQNFVIDTGTEPSVIDSRIAKKLHMAGAGGILGVHDRVVAVQQAVLPSVQIGSLRAAFLSVLIRDLSFLQKGLGIRIAAVIGLDVLRLSNFTIDYPTKRIIFRAAPVIGSSAPFQDTVPGLIVQMEVDGVPLHLMLDTGASGMLLFQSRIRDRLPQLTGLGERMSSNLGGEFRFQSVRVAAVHLGDTDFGQQSAFVVEDKADSSPEFDGLLGPLALAFNQIAFDFQRRTFSWKK